MFVGGVVDVGLVIVVGGGVDVGCSVVDGGNQEWTIQSYWQHWVQKTKNKDKQNKKTFHRKLKR